MSSAHELPPSIPADTRITVADYRALPDDGKRYELIEGDLDVTPAPGTRHQRVAGRVFVALDAYAERVGGEALITPIDVVIDEHTCLQPDVIYVAPGNAEIVGEELVEGPPDLVVEVLSPSTRRKDVLVKSRLYARFGVPACWIFDPDLDRLEAFVLEAGTYRLALQASTPDVVEPPGAPGLQLDLKRVFGR